MATERPIKSRLSKEDLQQALREQCDLLQITCETYDLGKEIVAKQLAVILRVLFHQTKQSHSLLGQLNLRSGYFVNTAHSLSPTNVASDFALASVQFTAGTGAKYKAMLGDGPPVTPGRKPFPEWWNDPVIKDQKGIKFSRRQIVLAVANTDGGGHVDPELEDAYKALTRDNSLRIYFSIGDGVDQEMGNPVLASLRQIAHETLATLKKNAPWLGT